MPEEERKMRGCLGPAPQPVVKLDDEPIYECPGRLVQEDLDVKLFLSVFSAMKTLQAMPLSGGILDQTNHLVEAAVIAEAEIQATLDAESKSVR